MASVASNMASRLTARSEALRLCVCPSRRSARSMASPVSSLQKPPPEAGAAAEYGHAVSAVDRAQAFRPAHDDRRDWERAVVEDVAEQVVPASFRGRAWLAALHLLADMDRVVGVLGQCSTLEASAHLASEWIRLAGAVRRALHRYFSSRQGSTPSTHCPASRRTKRLRCGACGPSCPSGALSSCGRRCGHRRTARPPSPLSAQVSRQLRWRERQARY